MREAYKVDILSPEECAELVLIEPEAVYIHMANDKVPYIDRQDGTYAIPLGGFLGSLEGLLDLKPQLIEQNERMLALNLEED